MLTKKGITIEEWPLPLRVRLNTSKGYIPTLSGAMNTGNTCGNSKLLNYIFKL